jgi:electron transport complex protein RnfE
VISCVVTIVDLGLQAYFYPLHHVLGIFIPLIVTNCIIIGRAEAFAFKNSVVRSFADGLAMGMGFLLVLVLLGALREVLGHGTLFREAHLMFGEGFQWLTITLLEDYRGLLLAVLPPGAFIGLGLLIAAKNAIDSYRAARLQAVPKLQPAG